MENSLLRRISARVKVLRSWNLFLIKVLHTLRPCIYLLAKQSPLTGIRRRPEWNPNSASFYKIWKFPGILRKTEWRLRDSKTWKTWKGSGWITLTMRNFQKIDISTMLEIIENARGESAALSKNRGNVAIAEETNCSGIFENWTTRRKETRGSLWWNGRGSPRPDTLRTIENIAGGVTLQLDGKPEAAMEETIP